MAEQGGDASAESCARPQQHQQEKAEHRGRQHQRKRGQCLEAGKPASAPHHQQRRQWHSDGQQDGRGDCRKAESESERLPIHHA